MGDTYFDVLRLPRNANDVQIGDAYRRLRAMYAGDPARLRAIEDAWRVLANPITRRAYTRALEEGRAPAINTHDNNPPGAPGDTPAQPASRIPPVQRPGSVTRRNKTELLDTSGAESNDTPPPPPPAQARRGRLPTELIDPEPERAAPGASADSASQPDAGDLHSQHSTDDLPRPAEDTPGPAPASRPEAGPEAGRDATRINPVRRPRPVATVEVAYQGSVEVFELPSGTHWIGRPSRDDPAPAVPLPDPDRFVSRKHARIFLDDSAWTVTDNSENGTLLNGRPLRRGQPSRLKDGDVLTIEGRALTIRRAGEG